MSFVSDHGHWSQAAQEAAARLRARLDGGEIDRVRYAWCDQHGIVRAKTLIGPRAASVLDDGLPMVGSLMLKDSTDHTVWPVFERGAGFAAPEFQGAADLVLLPDPGTCVDLPWSPGSAWVLCEARFSDGRPAPFDTRWQLRQAIAGAAAAGVGLRVGLEVEFHIFRRDDSPLAPDDAGWPGRAPTVTLLSPGYRLLSEQRYDQLEPVVELLRAPLLAMGLPLTSMEIELGPSQVEFVFGVQDALAGADAMVLFRNATKQILQRHGYHATFMCRPRLPHVMSSGWHLHQSLVEPQSGQNLFRSQTEELLSPIGQAWLGGLLAHADAATAFSTPTINGYRRYRPNALAPERINWGRDNRGALMRVIGGPGNPATRIENRGGEPAANPYLYLGSQLHSGMDGLARKLEPGASADAPYGPGFAALPRSLDEAIDALSASTCLRRGFGDPFIDYYVRLKQAELARFRLDVTEWEQREYFDHF